MQKNLKKNESAEPPPERDGTSAGTHRSADVKAMNLDVDVSNRSKALSRQSPVENDAKASATPIRCGGFHDFRNFCTDRRIIKLLCSQRIKEARKENKRQFNEPLRTSKPTAQKQIKHDLLPGRRQWRHFRPRKAERMKNPGTCNLTALINATLHSYKQDADSKWPNNLRLKITSLKERIFGEDFFLRTPEVNVVRKNADAHRAICRFDPDDNLIVSLTAQYFGQLFDPLFLSSCLTRRKKSRQDMRTWAMERIEEFCQAHSNSNIYVAEADIRSCFDSIDHNVLNQELAFLARTGNITIDQHAIAIWNAYLKCYSFPQNVLAEMHAIQTHKKSNINFNWPIKELQEFHENPLLSRLGIPQGGALSNVMINILLYSVDLAIEQFRQEGNDILFLRFCDDIIILSPSSEITSKGFEIYLGQLRRLKLPVYPPAEPSLYKAEGKKAHWNTKSKSTYPWGLNIQSGDIPWIGFLGYELRRDGALRIRKSSLSKQKDKMTSIVGRAISNIRKISNNNSVKSLKNTIQSYVNKTLGRLHAASCGRIMLDDAPRGTTHHSFCTAFAFLQDRTFPPNLLRALDRHRERNISRLKRAAQDVLGQKLRVYKGKRRMVKFRGHPFSYMARFSNNRKGGFGPKRP